MGWRSLAGSLGLHGATGVALALGLDAPERKPAPHFQPIEITTVPLGAPVAAVATPAALPTAEPSAPPSRSPTTRPRPSRGGAPAAGGGRPGALAMRGAKPRVTEPEGRPDEVKVPRPWELGKLDGAPPPDQLAPGALGGDVRAPKPYVPTGSGERDSLGPRMEHDGDGGYVENRPAFTARVDRDGTIHFEDKPNVQWGGFEGLGGIVTFDLTDAVMRALGDDPYAYEKMKIMERTRAVRAGMALRERQARLHDATVKLPARLDKVWRQPTWSAAQKRRLIFTLWDEAADTGDPEVMRAAVAVRAIIVKFVRERLPAGSPDAFSDAELEALNRGRQSKERFAPYAP